MRVIVCGSRTWSDDWLMDTVIGVLYERLRSENDSLHVIQGGVRGADAVAADWARAVGGTEYPADWTRYGKQAGYIRNKQMLDEGKPDMVLAFVDKPLEESKGTRNMVHLAKLAGIPTYVIQAVS